METLKLIALIIGSGILCGVAALMLALIGVSVYAFLLNLFTDDKEY